MSHPLWAHRSPPASNPTARVLGTWHPTSVAELTASRRLLAGLLADEVGSHGIDEGAVDGLLLAFEELGSNALRHGRRPVRVRLTEEADSWLLEVSDAAPDVPPVPSFDRDAALGGLGLHLVARLCGAHGWATRDGRKTAWACIERTRAEESA
jgi:anti-sigma regulatory factor (Ser/Thr protein kinase)